MAKIDLIPSFTMESATLYKDHHHSLRSRCHRRLCFCYYCTTLLLTVLLILSLTVFHIHHTTSTPSASLTSMPISMSPTSPSILMSPYPSPSPPQPQPRLLLLWLRLCSVLLPKRGRWRGRYPPRDIGAEAAVTMDVVLTVFAGMLVVDVHLYADVIVVEILVAMETRITGRVMVLGVIKRHMVTYNTCDVIVDVRNRSMRSLADRSEQETLRLLHPVSGVGYGGHGGG